MECFVIFVMAWCWFNATESKPQNVVRQFDVTTRKKLNVTGWFLEKIKLVVLKEIKNNLKTQKPLPFMKIAKDNGVMYSYFGNSKSTDK